MNELNNIKPNEALELMSDKGCECILLDVRTPREFAEKHVERSINFPLHTISPSLPDEFKGKRIICICQKGSRGAQAARTLCEYGLTNVSNVEGGVEAWGQAGLPLKKGVPTMSLERQVRIAAGALVVAGIAIAYFFTPYAALLSLFVGCGLIFSGITDTCGMALLLARCPWNSKV